MDRTERIGPERAHPIVQILRDQGRLQTWLARRIKRNPEYTNRVLNGLHPATTEFRAACAAALGLAAADLFHPANASSASAPDAPDDADSRAGIAAEVTAYSTGRGLPIGKTA